MCVYIANRYSKHNCNCDVDHDMGIDRNSGGGELWLAFGWQNAVLGFCPSQQSQEPVVVSMASSGCMERPSCVATIGGSGCCHAEQGEAGEEGQVP